MGGLLTLEEGVVVELSSDPVQDLATELACLARAANHAWTASATSAQVRRAVERRVCLTNVAGAV